MPDPRPMIDGHSESLARMKPPPSSLSKSSAGADTPACNHCGSVNVYNKPASGWPKLPTAKGKK